MGGWLGIEARYEGRKNLFEDREKLGGKMETSHSCCREGNALHIVAFRSIVQSPNLSLSVAMLTARGEHL